MNGKGKMAETSTGYKSKTLPLYLKKKKINKGCTFSCYKLK